MFDERGTLSLVDRKKNIFKLSQGEYVAPERLEVVFGNCPLIDQVYIHGDSLQSTLVAIVVPNEALLTQATGATLVHLLDKPFAALCRESEVAGLVLKAMDTWGRSNALKGFEIPKAVYLESDPFSIENGLLTPTLKVKRPAAKVHYVQTISDLYASLQAAS
ncbi:medium-chain fatty acid-CoA ligase faa2 [Coemansia biformis]|uniref:Medium-chain fatty acid-CoA ligase faa2 n=1 Tax=Coemansia biformis TaxID=1286918 RepID=A0A9W7XU51_9FUNG|nr:medium-chain fatty acid-CoA ligase faa2 [Coemansia biformis]